MTTKVLATLNANALGPGLMLSKGGMVVTTTQPSLSDGRKVLGTLPQGSGISSFECQFFTSSRPTTTPAGLRVGVAQLTSTLTVAPGNDTGSLSAAYQPSNGAIIFNNTSLVAIAPTPERTVISVVLDLAPLACSASFFINGSFGATQILPTGKLWVAAVTVYGGNAGDLSAYLNFGQVGMNFPALTAGV